MSGSGSAGWALRRLLAMSPGEVGLRAARAAREWRRRGRPALPQSEMASLSDVAGPPGEEPLDVQEVRDAIAEDRFSLLPGAEDPALLLERLEAAGGGLESVLTSAAGIAQGRLPAFGWTTIDAGRPIDWNRDPESGRPWPLDHWTRIDFRGEGGRGDPRYVWEVNRHHHLTTLARASLLTGDGDHAALAWHHMRSWIKANPPYHGVNWASALEVAIRLISWVSVADLSGCRDASDEEVDAVLTSVSLQADHVSDNLSVYASSKNNHLIGEAVGLLAVGTKFPMLAGAERWARLGSDVAVREITGQVTPGGASREQTFHYGTFVLEFALVALACLRRRGDGRAPALEERIARMAEFIAATGGPGGTPPSIGDEDGGRVLELSDAGVGRQAARAAAAAALMLGERPPDSTTPADLVPALWFVRDVDVGSAGSPRRVPDDAGGSRGGRPDVPTWYPEAGYFLGGAGAHHGVVDCGPLGYLSIAAHGHADCLSASLAYEREWYLVDPGTFCYHREPEWRDHFRGTLAHNTVAVDGADQSEMLGPFLWGKRATAHAACVAHDELLQCFEGWHDGYAREQGVIHRRTVVFGAAGYWVFIDRLLGVGNHEVRCTFQFAPGFAPAPGGDLSFRRDGLTVDLWRSLPEGLSERVLSGETDPPEGWVSRGFGHREPAPALLFEGRCSLPAECVFVIVPNGRQRGFGVECARAVEGSPSIIRVDHHQGTDSLLSGAGRAPGGRFEGRLGLAAERARDRQLLGIDVAHWTDAQGAVPFRPVRNLTGSAESRGESEDV